MQERPHAMTEIDIASDQEHAERGGTAATDLQLESEQRAMQALYDYQSAVEIAFLYVWIGSLYVSTPMPYACECEH